MPLTRLSNGLGAAEGGCSLGAADPDAADAEDEGATEAVPLLPLAAGVLESVAVHAVRKSVAAMVTMSDRAMPGSL
jgi:hypothetical protein